MKTYLIIILTFVFCVNNSIQAQETPAKAETVSNNPKLQKGVFGIRFMPTVSSIKVQNSDGTLTADFVTGYGYGGLIGINFNKNFGLQAELIYNRISQKHTDRNLERRIDLSYINIPILLSLNTDKTAAVNGNLVVGQV
jgi:hypothetical protein